MRKSLFDQIEDSLSHIADGSSCHECGGEYGSYHAKQILPKVKKLRDALKSLQRYEHAIWDNGDGYIDDSASEDSDGDYVKWAELQKVLNLTE